MSENTVNKALRTMGYSGDVMTGHGFRNLVSTLLNEQQCWHPDALRCRSRGELREPTRAQREWLEASHLTADADQFYFGGALDLRRLTDVPGAIFGIGADSHPDTLERYYCDAAGF